MLSELTVTLFPTALSVNARGGLVLPSATLPKVRLAGVTVSPAPVPARFAVARGVVPLFRDREPEALPVAVGAKVTGTTALFPEAIVTGKVIPLTPNPAPVTVAAVSVTSPPAALKIAWICPVDPRLTFPKLKLEGLNESLPPAVVKFSPATFALFTVADRLSGTKL